MSIRVTAKAHFRIRVAGGQVVVIDGKGKKGGNVWRRQGKHLTWSNETHGTCKLKFFRLRPAESGSADEPAWPFDEPPGPARAGVTLMASAGPRAGVFSGRLKRARNTQCYKYNIEVRKGRRVYRLDPIIIVRPA